MIVKAQTLRSTGHHPTAAARRAYLQRDGREVGIATQGIVDEERWDAEMDRTTRQYHLRGTVIAREYVLSPDPRDNVTRDQLMAFSSEWMEKLFPNHECVAVLHEDNSTRSTADGILHAHVYVNAPDLESGKKMSIDRARAREIHDVTQDMASARGWGEQERYVSEESGRVRHLQSRRSEYDRRPCWQRLEERRNAEYDRSPVRGRVSRFEYESAVNGAPLDKTVIRRALKLSVDDVRTGSAPNLKEALLGRGVEMENASNGDFKYRVEGHGRWFRGSTIGEGCSRHEMSASLARSRSIEHVPIGRDSPICFV